MVLHDDGEVIIEDVVAIMNETQFEAILILQCICLEVAKHCSCWQIVCKPGGMAKQERKM